MLAPYLVGRTKRSQGLFNLIFATRAWLSHPSMTSIHRIKHSSRSSVSIHPNEMAKAVEALDIITLGNVHVIEELIQLPIGSDTVVITNSYWTKELAQHFSIEHSQGSCIVACLSVHASAP